MGSPTNISGYDSIAMSAAEWRKIVPEKSTFTGVIGSYGNGRWTNTAFARQAFPKAKHVVYDVNGSRPQDDILDDEPGNAGDSAAPGWARAHNRISGPHLLPLPAIYKSASGVSGLISIMLDNGWKRSEFLIQSAHYGHGPHICGPDTCGQSPQVDATQYTDKGSNGQNTDLSLFAPHFFKMPVPDPDARYHLFDDVVRSMIQGATERGTVHQYDIWRAMQTPTNHPHRFGLAVRRARMRILAGRLQRVIASEGSHPLPYQQWRVRELRDRAAGRRLV